MSSRKSISLNEVEQFVWIRLGELVDALLAIPDRSEFAELPDHCRAALADRIDEVATEIVAGVDGAIESLRRKARPAT